MKEEMANRNKPRDLRYLILDLRASTHDVEDDAVILDTAHTLTEAEEAARAQGGGVIWDCERDMMAKVVQCTGARRRGNTQA